MTAKTVLFILLIVVLLGSAAFMTIQHPEEKFFRRDMLVIAIASVVLITDIFGQAQRRRAWERHVQGISKFFEMIEKAGDFTHHSIGKANGLYQLTWISQKLNVMVGFRIDGTSAWCHFQEPHDDHLWRFDGTPSGVVDFVRSRAANSVTQ